MPLFVRIKDGMKHAGHGPGEVIEVTKEELASFGDKFMLPSDRISDAPDILAYPSPDPHSVVEDRVYVVRVKEGLKHAGHVGGEIVVVTAAEVVSFHDKFEIVPAELVGDEIASIIEREETDVSVTLAKMVAESLLVRPVVLNIDAVDEDESEPEQEPEQEPPAKRRPFSATPSAMALAIEHDMDLALIDGTGAKGRITKGDVERAIGRTE